MLTMTGAELTVQLLERQGVDIIAGIPGASNLPFYDVLARRKKIRHVLARHEQGAGFMAQGMARVSGRPGVCVTTSGPGVTNILTALADAKLDSVPLICITGQVPRAMMGTDAFQEVDTYGLSIPITKHNFLVRSAEELLTIIPRAFTLAMSGRTGPVLIDIPRDVQDEMVTFTEWPAPGMAEITPLPARHSLERCAQLINKAKRPVICLGGGAARSGAEQAARNLAEKAAMPAAMTLMGLGLMPADHPLSLGMLGMHGARYTNMVLEECDLFLAVGIRFDDRATGKVTEFCPNATIVHVDIDPCELDKIKTSAMSIGGDAKTVLESLVELVEPVSRSEWLDRVNILRRDFAYAFDRIDDPLSSYGLVARTGQMLDDETLITTDVGQHQMRTAQAYPFAYSRQWLTSGGLGTMGFGLPAAIGAALAAPEVRVVCFSGDGSILMNIQEMATAVEENVNVKIVLADNRCLGLVHQIQDMFFHKRHYATEYRVQVDFLAVARGFGMAAVDLGIADDPAAALKQALDGPGPCLIRVPVSALDHVFPMVPSGAANTEMIGGKSHV
ncbi:MAG: acetolactate synthase large subunit [Desulfoplanes sp.]